MSVAASTLSTRNASSLTASAAPSRNAESAPAQARGVHWVRYALRGLATVVGAVLANNLFY